MRTLILTNAKKDLPLYLMEFKSFWQQTEQTISDEDLIACYTNTLVFKNWKIALNHLGIYNLDSILIELFEDVNSAFFLAYMGQYRSSHMHLRSLIELSLQLLYFFHHEIEFSQWKKGDFKIKHDELTKYLKNHPHLNNSGDSINQLSEKWKLFSKFIHAEAPSFFQTTLPSNISQQFSIPDFNVWKSNYLKTGYKLNRLFLEFFKHEINSFPTKTKEILFETLTEDDLRQLGYEP